MGDYKNWSKIYGDKFDSAVGNSYKHIFDECKNTKNVNYLGFLENKKVLELLSSTHFFTHPSIWPETSCVSAIESRAAGCNIITTNLGAMYETCAPFGTFVNFDRNFEILEKRYRKVLLNSIENYWSKETKNFFEKIYKESKAKSLFPLYQ